MHYNRALLAGEIGRRTPEELFWENVEPTGFCWLWTGNINDSGYGRFGSGGSVRAHRRAWEFLIGPIPAGLELDHLCRVRHCVNPDHLEPVPGVVNNDRSYSPTAINKRMTKCKEGHEFTPENAHITSSNERRCRKCDARRAREYRARKKVAAC